MPKNPARTRDELLLALDLYPAGQHRRPGHDHPEVIALSRLLIGANKT